MKPAGPTKTPERSQQNQGTYRPGGPIVLVPYEAGWENAFAVEASNLRAALGEVLIEIHHIGSTAIPGIVAKPVIDMLALCTSLVALDERRTTFEALGYEALGEFGIPGRRYYRKNSPDGSRSHQVHAFLADAPDAQRHLAFRDYLRAHPAAARQYSELKLALAAKWGTDIERYAEAKTAFVRGIEERATRAL
jgi:GrpB-like predicted nucleotidyltransferase (UPF0157 family)